MDERSFTIITVAILVISPILLYMNSDETLEQDSSMYDDGLVPVWERVNQNFNTTGSYSYTLESGKSGTLGPDSVFIDVDLPSSELGCTITDDCQVHLGLWLPDVPNGTKVPVIADVGPYYDDGDVDALTPANRLGKFLIENMVPHGYAVAQVSVFGTGMSNHCMDFMGLSEQLGIDAGSVQLFQRNDPIIDGSKKIVLIPDGGIGCFLENDDWYVGYSLKNIMVNNWQNLILSAQHCSRPLGGSPTGGSGSPKWGIKGGCGIGISSLGRGWITGPKKAVRRNLSDLPAPAVIGRTGLIPAVCGF